MTESRKQREIAKRHALFLALGKRILHEEGFHMLSMERIAELAEYSKGTVYQHFTCKEEILIQLCIEAKTDLLECFKRAANLEGSNRDRMLAVFYANHRWNCCEGNEFEMMQHLSMHGVREKVTQRSLEKSDRLEQGLFGLVQSIVDEAIKNNELPKHKHMNSAETVFGLWSLSTGGQLLQTSEIPLNEFGIRDPNMTLLRTLSCALDGLNWQPLHNESHFKKLIKRVETSVFPLKK